MYEQQQLNRWPILGTPTLKPPRWSLRKGPAKSLGKEEEKNEVFGEFPGTTSAGPSIVEASSASSVCTDKRVVEELREKGVALSSTAAGIDEQLRKKWERAHGQIRSHCERK